MPKATPAPIRNLCVYCATANPAGARFCIRCGKPLESEPTSSARESLPEQRSGPGILTPQPGQQTILIGRDPELADTGHVYLPHPAISRHHARIEQRGNQWFVIDLFSKKGTFVNFTSVPPGDSGIVLAENDMIWIAPYAFYFRTDKQGRTLEPASMRLDAVDLVRRVSVKGQDLTILDTRGVPLVFQPGEFIALVGGSGAGKTTLMRAINGLNPAQEGRVYIDGQIIIDQGNARRFQALYSIMGYVPQDDILHRNLTVREALTYTGYLRLAALSKDELQAVIQDTLNAVELAEHADKCVNQLSGGQRKRVNIAMELIAQPRILFLDEPTSGLDPGLDLEMMRLLHRWAKGSNMTNKGSKGITAGDSRTIILVTHATENIELCDYITFMAPGGRIAYFGPPNEAKTYFFPHKPSSDVSYSQLYRAVVQPPPNGGGTTSSWPERYLQSQAFQKYVQSRAQLPLLATIPNTADTAEFTHSKQPRSLQQFKAAWTQFRHLASRYTRLILRDQLNIVFLLTEAPLTALLLAAVSSQNALQSAGAMDAEKLLFILACAATWLGIINATKEIVKERDIYKRERLYGLRAGPYVFSKITVLGAIALLQSFLLVLFIGWQFRLPDAGIFLPFPIEMGITLFLSMLAGLALGLLISAYARSSDLATTLMFLALIVQIIFSGLLFDAKGLARIPSWLTSSRWSLEALGSSADLNSLLVGVIPGYDWDPGYASSSLNLGFHWFVLLSFSCIFVMLAIYKQDRE